MHKYNTENLKENCFTKNLVKILLLLMLISLNANIVFSLPAPTMVYGNLLNVTNPNNINSYEIKISAYEAGTNFSVFLTEEIAEFETERLLYGNVLATEFGKSLDIIIEARILTPLYRFTGFEYIYDIPATETVNKNISMTRTLRIIQEPEPPHENHPNPDQPSTGGSIGGSSGGISRTPDDIDTSSIGDPRRSEMPPLTNISDEELLREIKQRYKESDELFANEEFERLRKLLNENIEQQQEIIIVNTAEILINTSIVVLLIILIMFVFAVNKKNHSNIDSLDNRNNNNRITENKTNNNYKKNKLKPKNNNKKIFLFILLGIFLLQLYSVEALRPQSVQGRIIGPNKYDALWNITFYDGVTGEIVVDGGNRFGTEEGMTQFDTPHPFYATAITMQTDDIDPYYVHVNVENGEAHGFNQTENTIIHSQAPLSLNIIMRAPLPIHSPLDQSLKNESYFLINWSYPNNDWILFDVEIDINSDFSSPIRVWELNETSYQMVPGESIPDGDYYLRVRTKDVSDNDAHVYIDETIIELTIDTIEPEIISYTPANETWHNSDITFSVQTNEPAICRIDTTSETPFSSKPYTMSGTETTTHMFTTAFTSNGEYNYFIQCIDLAGNIMNLNDELHLRYFFDNVHPVTTDNYTQDDTWTTEDALIELTAVDASPSSGIEWTRYCIGSGCNPSTGIDYTVPLDFSEGHHILRYRSKDYAGNYEPINEIIIKIDQTAPTTTHNYGYDNTWSNEDAIIELTSQDPTPGSGVQSINYCFGNECNPNIEYTSPIEITDEDTTILRFNSVDNVGNLENTQTLTIMIDKTGPTCNNAFIEIENGNVYSTSTTLNFIFDGFEDPLSGIWRYHYSFEDTGDISNPTTNLFGTLTNSEQGEVFIYVWAEDNVGNIGCSVQDSIIVDTIPPEFIDFENMNITSDSTTSLSVNATIRDQTTSIQGLPTIRYRYGTGPWSDYYDMDNIEGDIFSFEIPEYSNGWFNFRTQTVYWEINVTDILGNHDVSALQSEYVNAINYQPFFHPIIQNKSVETYTLLQFWIDAIDPNNDGIENQDLQFSSNVSEINITKFNNSRALVEWVPDNSWTINNQNTIHTINFSVTDDGIPPLTGWQLVDIEINFSNLPPVLEPIGHLSVDENDTLYYQVIAYDPDGDEITFYDNSTLFDIDPVTGEIFYEPDWTHVGIYYINITVGDFEFNVSEVITLEVVNVENNVTFFVRDRILERPLNNITIYGGHNCVSGCNFDEQLRIVEPNGDYDYIITKQGFSTYTLNNQAIYDETNYTILLNDTEEPFSDKDFIFLDYTIQDTGTRFIVNTTFYGEDNFFINNATMNYIRYEKGMNSIYETNKVNLEIIEDSDDKKLFNVSLGEYSTSFVMDANVTLFDLYNNSKTIPMVRTQFLFEIDGMAIVYPPILNEIKSPKHLIINEPFTYTVLASDYLGEELTFSDNSTIFNINPNTGEISFTPTLSDVGTHSVNISVSNIAATSYQIVEFIVEEGQNVNFDVRDDLIFSPINDVTITGGRNCINGCQFNGNINLIETTEETKFTISAQGYETQEIIHSPQDGETVQIYLTDIEPPKTEEINLTAEVTSDGEEYYIEIKAIVTDNLGVSNVQFYYEIIDSNDLSYIGESETITLSEQGNNLYTGTIGPFQNTIYFQSWQFMTDYQGNYEEHKNALRHFLFESRQVSVPEIVITKNVEYVSQELYNVTYRITNTIHNTASIDLENIRFIDTDMSPTFQYFNISSEDTATIETYITYDKNAISGMIQLVSAAANILDKDFYSNRPTLLIPGFGGPFDVILYPHSPTYESGETITLDIYLENMNPDYGQDGILEYWTETVDGEIIDLRQESLFVQASSSLLVERELYPIILPDETDTPYRIKANLTWTRGQQAFATRTITIVYGGPTCYDGIKNQDETDVDCGGNICGPCVNGLQCNANDDCMSGRCLRGFCFPATCNDGIQNQGETDIDCGGPCDPCEEGYRCISNDDCRSGVCQNNMCMPYLDHCFDGIRNNGETDVDCGGPCRPCDAGMSCQNNNDCVSLNCAFNVCLPATCNDGIQNQGETGIDCGGPCRPCLTEIDREREVDDDSFVTTRFGTTNIITSGNPLFLSMSIHFDSNIMEYEKQTPTTTIVRNNGHIAQDMILTKTIPPEFDVIPITEGLTTHKDENGENILEWEGNIRSERSKELKYYLVYNEKYRLHFEKDDSDLKVYNNSFMSTNFIKVYSKQRLQEKLDVKKILSYNEITNNVSVTIELQNTGEIPLRDIVLKELIPDDTTIEFWIRNDGEIKISEIKPFETITYTYETLDHNHITKSPIVFGVEPENLNSILVVDSHRTLIERVIRIVKIQSVFLLIALIITIMYLYNFNIRKNSHKMPLKQSIIKSTYDTQKSVKNLISKIYGFFKVSIPKTISSLKEINQKIIKKKQEKNIKKQKETNNNDN